MCILISMVPTVKEVERRDKPNNVRNLCQISLGPLIKFGVKI